MYCDSANVSSSQVLYTEKIRGYPKAHLIKLSCELFGLAGHYVVKLRPIAPVAASVSATAYIQVNLKHTHCICFPHIITFLLHVLKTSENKNGTKFLVRIFLNVIGHIQTQKNYMILLLLNLKIQSRAHSC